MRILLAGFLVLPFLAALARAQPPAGPALPPGKAAVIADVRFGWQDAIIAERWNPVRVFLTGGDKGFSGTLITEFNQDVSQGARISTPVAATPGRTIPIDLAAAIPATCGRIEFTLVSDSGREVDRLVYDHLPGPREIQFNPARLFDQGLILALGATSLPAAFETVPAAAAVAPQFDPSAATPEGEALTEHRWNALKLARLEPDGLSMLWPAYDAAAIIVIRTESIADADPRDIDAVRAWVRGGGRLCLIIDAPGSRWRRWLPDGPEGDLFVPEPPARHAPPDALRSIFAAAEEATPAPMVQARALRLTPAGRAEAWSLDWTLGAEDEGPAGAGLIAQGPVDFGWVTVVGVEPQACAASYSKPAIAAAWRSILERAFAEWLRRSPDPELQFVQYMGSTSGADGTERWALRELLERLTGASPVGPGVIIAILGGMLLLTLLVGPVDALVLRRLRWRQHSWITALGWIATMSVIAYLLPPMMRTGPSVISRLTVTDVIADPDAPPGHARAWSTGLTNYFASRAGPVELGPARPGSWWRGISAAVGRADGRRTLPPFSTRIDTGGPGGQEIRGAAPAGLTQGQWTYRAFTDNGPASAELSARVRRSNDHWSLTLIGAPPGLRMLQSELIIAGRTHPVQWTTASSATSPISARTWRGRTTPVPEAGASDRSFRPDEAPESDEPLSRRGSSVMLAGAPAPPPGPRFSPQSLDVATVLNLPGVAPRTPAIKARTDSGRWAELRLLADGFAPDFEQAEAQQTLARVYRILIPIPPDAERPEDSE